MRIHALGTKSEEAIRDPQNRTIVVERTFKFGSGAGAAIRTLELEMWFSML
jgi:hypothetical protein